MNSLAYTLFGGFAMALADSVPGVSGGTVAFLLGFYERFVGALDALVHGTWSEKKHASAVTYAVLGMMVGSLYAIIVGPATLKVPQHAMTLADFDALWLALGAALMLALSFLKSRLARRRETGVEGNGFFAGMDKKELLR